MVKILKALWHKICYYHFLLFGMYGFILYKIKDSLYFKVLNRIYVFNPPDYLINMLRMIYISIRYLLYTLLILIWVIPFYLVIISKRYYKVTKRSYLADKFTYNRSYRELVNFFEENTHHMLYTDELPSLKWYESHGIVFGRKGTHLISFEPSTKENGTNGIVAMLWGSPGDGKSATLGCTCRVFKGSILTLDPKGELYDANHAFRDIKRFSLLYPGESYHYDPLSTIRASSDDEEKALFLDNLGITLIADEKSKESAYFVDVARSFFTAIFLYSLKKDPYKSFTDICQEISLKSFVDWGKEIEEYGYITAMSYSNRFKDENPNNVGGGYSKLVGSLKIYTSKILRTLLSNNGSCITPEDLENGSDVYIQVDPTTISYYAPVIAMIFQDFMSAALHRPRNNPYPLAYILDEFGQLPAMPVITQSAALMRAYNASIIISTQSLSQIDLKYGLENRKTLIDCAKVHCFLSVQDVDTKKWASEKIGYKKVLKKSNSTNNSSSDTSSVGSSVSESLEPILRPDEFELLPHSNSIAIQYFGKYIKGKKTYYFKK